MRSLRRRGFENAFCRSEETTQEISALLRGLNTEYGIAIIPVTHDAQVAQAAARSLGMVDGQLH